jgi:uncharacterized protein YgiM (DUF1202 family)
MDSIFRRMINIIGFLGLWVMIFPNMGATHESISAELTTNVNLRQAPDKNGKTIVIIKKGERVFVQEENPEWANVVYEKNGHKNNGWISAKFLLKTPTAPEELKAKDVEVKPANQAPQSFPNTGFAGPSPIPISAATEKQRTVVSEPLMSSDNTVANSATVPLSGDDVSSFFKNKKDIPMKTQNSNLESGQTPTIKLIGVITRFLFKISLVIMSCVALIFSYSALMIAKSNRHAQYVKD